MLALSGPISSRRPGESAAPPTILPVRRPRTLERHLSDAELILIGGLLLGSGIAAAMVADRVRVPGLILFLGLGMLVGSEGVRRGRVRRRRADQDARDDRPGPDPLRGRAHRRLAGDPPGPEDGRFARRRRHDPDRGDRRPGGVLALRRRHARGPDHRLGDRSDRLGGDLRRPPRLDPAPQARPRSRGRVGAERPGRRSPRHRVHRLDPGARATGSRTCSSSSPAIC